jgi:general secretion pathway protein N
MRYLIVLAAALVALPAHSSESVRNAAPSARLNPSLANPLASVRLEDLSVTRERPLFSPTRRPPPLVEAPEVQVVEKKETTSPTSPFDLLGVVTGDEKSFVLLRNRDTHEVTRLRRGDEKDGWTVEAVRIRSVALERNGRIENLALAIPAAAGAQSAPQLAGAALPPTTNETSAQDSPPIAEYKRLMRKLKLQ